jgi:hypothetical protein
MPAMGLGDRVVEAADLVDEPEVRPGAGPDVALGDLAHADRRLRPPRRRRRSCRCGPSSGEGRPLGRVNSAHAERAAWRADPSWRTSTPNASAAQVEPAAERDQPVSVETGDDGRAPDETQ